MGTTITKGSITHKYEKQKNSSETQNPQKGKRTLFRENESIGKTDMALQERDTSLGN